MKMIKNKIVVVCLLLFGAGSYAQKDLVKFGAISRGVVQESTLEAADTTNPNKDNGGQAVVDLRLNINPNRKTEIGTVIRLESELGGFFGSGSAISLRQLYVKGLLYDVVSYELGDIYLELSPYTLYNSNGELSKNEASIFNELRQDYTEYDNFNIGNSWWSQGGHVNFGLDFDSTKTTGMQFDIFSSRILAPSTMRFLSGGRVGLFQKNLYNVNLNVVRVNDAAKVTPLVESLDNVVASLEWKYQIVDALSFFGEAGVSRYGIDAPVDFVGEYDAPEDREGEFVNAGLQLDLMDKKFVTKLKYLRNSAHFYSAGAQTKRLDFTAAPQLFLNVANDPFNNRALNMADILFNTDMYNAEISGTLMDYDPFYGNVTPYGEATPNRQGLWLTSEYAGDEDLFKVGFEAALLTDVTGVGTDNKRSFRRLNAYGNLDVAQLTGYSKQFNVQASFTNESTQRDGESAGIDLQTNAIDAGLEVEVLKKFYIYGGVKSLSGAGNEYQYDLSDNNTYNVPAYYSVDMSQFLTGAGVKYKFSDNMYLSLKNFNVNVTNNEDEDLSYAYNQWLLFFSLKL